MDDSAPAPRRRRWPLVMPLVLVVVLAAAWSGFWYFAAAKAQTTLGDWRAREAKAGRIHTCGTQTVGGFPFRLELSCTDPVTELRGAKVSLKAKSFLAAVQVYDPTLMIAEVAGPMTITVPGEAGYVADWTLAQTSVRGTPASPQRVSIVVDGPSVDRVGEGQAKVFKAGRAELHGRIVEGSAAADPVVEVVLRLASAVAPTLHPLAAHPLDAEVNATLRGLADFAPKPWPERLREIQAHGGTIEITAARLQQDDVIAVGAGKLGLTKTGSLDGQMQITVVGIEKLLKALDLEKVMSQGKVGQTIDALDRLMPGLGNIARQNATPSILAGLGAIGRNTMLEGKPAVSVPLRFVDGSARLGPFEIGRVPPLF